MWKTKRGSLRRTTGLKRTGLNSRGNLRRKSIQPKQKSFNVERHTKDWDFFDMLWEKHPDRKCESCNKQLFGENLSMYHDHLIEKSERDDLRYNPLNMALVCGDCHASKSRGHPTEKHQELINKAKRRFK